MTLSASPSSDLLTQAVALHRAGNFDGAEVIYRTLLASNPQHVDALSLLGTIYAQRGQHEEGIALLEKAIAVNPNYGEAHYNRGLSLQKLGRHEEALASYDKTLTLDSRHTEAANNRGLALYNLKRYAEALDSQNKAIAADPSYGEAYWNKGLIKLLLGEYEEGWKLYEWRWKRRGYSKARDFGKPLWLGEESLNGKTILLYTEQGFGDAIQFCRYIPMVEKLGAKIIVESAEKLKELFSTLQCTFQLVTKGNALPEFDLHCPLLSLPLAFKTTIHTIPADIPYLFADAHKQKIWQDRLGTKTKPRIGLVWSGAATNENDRQRSIALHLLTPLLECACEFHALQKEIRPEDAQVIEQQSAIALHAEYLQNFADTAALVSQMDLIVSVDTSVAHLAGALGKPVWIMLPFAPDFRWFTERRDSLWYPTARLFRQSRVGNWESAIKKIVIELEKL